MVILKSLGCNAPQHPLPCIFYLLLNTIYRVRSTKEILIGIQISWLLDNSLAPWAEELLFKVLMIVGLSSSLYKYSSLKTVVLFHKTALSSKLWSKMYYLHKTQSYIWLYLHVTIFLFTTHNYNLKASVLDKCPIKYHLNLFVENNNLVIM